MRSSVAILVFVVIVLAVLRGARAAGWNGSRSRYGFYRSFGRRDMWSDKVIPTRRVFGGMAAQLSTFPSACVMLDRYWTARCTAAVVATRWALTAAHCVSPKVAYIKYNARLPSSLEGDVAPVDYLYRHPGYKVVQEDEGNGVDVTLLHHDVGLVRTRTDMNLRQRRELDPIRSMRRYNPIDLKNQEVQVLGFGRTERSMLGEELFMVQLKLVYCERGAWFHCVCGVAPGDSRGVCSGDSGGPVVYRGVQIGVTSMGPLECSRSQSMAPGATSVFTALYNYVDLVAATINDTEQAMRMRKINRAPRPAAAPHSLLLALAHLLLTALPLPAR